MTDTNRIEQQPQGGGFNPLVHATVAADRDAEISLIELLQFVWEQKWLIVLLSLIGLTLGVVVAVKSQPAYKAEVLIAPATKPGATTNDSAGGGVGSLVSLAGLNLSGSSTETNNALAVLNSRLFISKFVDELNLKPELFPGRWDKESGKWIEVKRDGLVDSIRAYLKENLFPPEPEYYQRVDSKEPHDWETQKRFREIFTVSEGLKPGFTEIVIEWRDPEQAAFIANELIRRLNDHIKEKRVLEAEKSIEYLERQLGKTSLVDLKQILYKLTEEQIKTIMLAEVSDEFAFSIIDPAVVPMERSRPRRGLLVLLGGAIGVFLGALFAFVRFAVRSNSIKEPVNVVEDVTVSE